LNCNNWVISPNACRRSCFATSEAVSLAGEQKVGNIPRKRKVTSISVDASLLLEPAEQALHQASPSLPRLKAFDAGDYTTSLQISRALKAGRYLF
jgi:hypothetical protein